MWEKVCDNCGWRNCGSKLCCYICGAGLEPQSHQPDIEEIIRLYKQLGFKEKHYYKGEYTLMVDSNYRKVRVYENGNVWKANCVTGEYIKVVK